VTVRVLHLSDLHLGSKGGEVGGPGLAELIERASPEAIVVTGDVANRGRRNQEEGAADYLRSLGPPVLPVPGNHDLPYSFPGRFVHPWREFERQWATTEPLHRSERLLAIGLNSARPWRHQSGKLRRSSLERTARLLAETPPEVFRVVFFHHHLTCAPWRSRKRTLSGRRRVLRRLAEGGVDLICSGHIHQSSVIERHEFLVDGAKRALVVATAPGLGRPRPRRDREAHGLQLYSFDEGAITVETHVWREGELRLVAERRFPR
jgi:3',5'-cyclic AMP phosphodiesterase CpdA